MNKKVLLTIGGTLNAIFVLFHIWLGYMIHVNPAISQADRPLMEMLNVGGLLMILFITVASLSFKREMLSTSLGKLVSLLNIALYWSRAVEEIIISPVTSPIILISCFILGLIYVPLLFTSKKEIEEPNSVFN